MARELRPLVRELGLKKSSGDLRGRRRGGDLWTGRPGQQGSQSVPAAVATVGVGPRRAGDATAALVDRLAPSWVVVTGIAGAIDARLQIGDVVEPDVVVDARSGKRYLPHGARSLRDRGESGRESGAPGDLTAPPPTAPALVTVEGLGGADSLPAELAAGAGVVDMETAAIAEVCETRGIPWNVIRAVSDRPGTLTTAITGLVDPHGRVRAGALVRLVITEPRQAIALARLGTDTRRAIAASTRTTRRRVDELRIRLAARDHAAPPESAP